MAGPIHLTKKIVWIILSQNLWIAMSHPVLPSTQIGSRLLDVLICALRVYTLFREKTFDMNFLLLLVSVGIIFL